MNPLAANRSSTSANVAALLAAATPTTTGATSSRSTSISSTASSTFGDATSIDLSDQAKAAVAKARSDHDVAVRVAAFAAAARAASAGTSTGSTARPITDLAIDLPPPDLTGLSPQGNFTSRNGTIWATNTVSTGPGSAHVAFVPTVEPMIDFTSRLEAGGFSIEATGNAGDGTYAVNIQGPDGFGWSNSRSTPGAGLDDAAAGSTPPGIGYILSEPGPGNTQTVHFYEDGVSAAGVTASSDAGTLSVAAASARTLLATVSIDFSTGIIQLQSSSASATALSTRLSLSV